MARWPGSRQWPTWPSSCPAGRPWPGRSGGRPPCPGWPAPHQERPSVFVGSAASAAGGFGLLAAPAAEQEPARRLAVLGSVAELAARQVLERRLGDPLAEPYHQGKSGKILKAAEALTVAGAAGAALTRRTRIGSGLSGLALLPASALTRYGIFEAGMASARDPRYTVVPQRQRVGDRAGRVYPDGRASQEQGGGSVADLRTW